MTSPMAASSPSTVLRETWSDQGAEYDPGSFRDPTGRVVIADARVFRLVSTRGWSQFEALRSAGLLDQLIKSSQLWPARLIDPTDAPPGVAALAKRTEARVIEHPELPLVSYPYEWPFTLAKRAALHHIDLHLDLLEHDFSLVDGSAYNVQFAGVRPVFIDTLSITPYAEGEPWLGYQQFCNQFLNPILLSAAVGIQYHAWFRGNLEGIGVEETARVLPWHKKLSWGVFSHVALHAKLLSRTAAQVHSGGQNQNLRGPSKRGLMALLLGMRRTINRLNPKGLNATQWRNYETTKSYDAGETEAKKNFVAAFAELVKPAMLWDFGCNTGAFSEVALQNGAASVVGFDFDPGALESAVARADDKNLQMLPLHLDATNPSPSQGWRQKERAGLAERANAQGLLALAFLHHLVIGKNIPMVDAITWLTDFAPAGVIEFVSKSDPMVQGMLANRKDIFDDYNIETFRHILAGRARIVREEQISQRGRSLFVYDRSTSIGHA